MNTPPEFLEGLRSRFPGLAWPTLPDANASAMLALLYQVQQAETQPAEWVRDRQLHQAATLLRHAANTVPHYRESIPGELLQGALDEARWLDVPLLSRQQVQSAGSALLCERPPQGHEKAGEKVTSGSTGMPVTVYSTQVTRLFWLMNSVRDLLWQGWDLAAPLAVIRPEVDLPPGESQQRQGWGYATSLLTSTGPGLAMNVRTPVHQQLDWLRQQFGARQQGYLLSLPTNLRALAEQGYDFAGIKGLASYGELLDEPTRAIVEAAAGLRVADTYSSVEVGAMSLQCPEAGGRHILSDSVLLEVLNEQDRPCAPGETGRVVVTLLHNLYAPLIRYEVGDYAVAGGSCSCGRTYPLLERVLGRQRNMIHHPDGSQHWPSLPVKDWARGVPVRQFQVVQLTLERIRVNLVVTATVSAEQEQFMREQLTHYLAWPFEFEFSYVDEIPRSKGGKYEDVVSML